MAVALEDLHDTTSDDWFRQMELLASDRGSCTGASPLLKKAPVLADLSATESEDWFAQFEATGDSATMPTAILTDPCDVFGDTNGLFEDDGQQAFAGNCRMERQFVPPFLDDVVRVVMEFLPSSAYPACRLVCELWNEVIQDMLENDEALQQSVDAYTREALVRLGTIGVRVAVRVRPSFDADSLVVQGRTIRFANVPVGAADGQFFYDNCFPHSATQTEVYNTLRPQLMRAISQGVNLCVFAYGQTGSGKTHTMFGSALPGEEGIGWRLFREVLHTWLPVHSIQLSALEVYNERIYDLLTDSDTPLPNPTVDMLPTAATLIEIHSPDTLHGALHAALAQRRSAATCYNRVSSRSHAIITLHVGAPSVMMRVHLADLAGSERAAPNAYQLREGCAINKSLSTLGRVIGVLARQEARAHVPYRDSTLTFLLRDSITGKQGRVIMLAAVNPEHPLETRSTLQYASIFSSLRNPWIAKIRRTGRLLTIYRRNLKAIDAELAVEYQKRDKKAATRTQVQPATRAVSSGSAKKPKRLPRSVRRMINRLYELPMAVLQQSSRISSLEEQRNRLVLRIATLSGQLNQLKANEAAWLRSNH